VGLCALVLLSWFAQSQANIDFDYFYEFRFINGCLPKGTLIYNDADSHFYGYTADGGAYDGGAIFQISHKLATFNKFVDFYPGITGFSPTHGNLFIDGKVMWGVTQNGPTANNTDYGGTIYSIRTDGEQFKTHFTFDQELSSSSMVGCSLHNTLVKGPDGLLYMTTSNGGPGYQKCNYGTGDAGTLFRFNRTTSELEIVHAFTCEPYMYGEISEHSHQIEENEDFTGRTHSLEERNFLKTRVSPEKPSQSTQIPFDTHSSPCFDEAMENIFVAARHGGRYGDGGIVKVIHLLPLYRTRKWREI
tara:strand:- start:39 stop:947 length:909 start_codon:yes stop_codon:yes gene_type:complete